MKLLIIEDDEGAALSVGAMLKGLRGLEVAKARTLAEGLDRAPEAEMIVLDLKLPDSDPEDTVEAIGSLAVYAPVLVLTGVGIDINDSAELFLRCIDRGAEFCVFKTDICGHGGVGWFRSIVLSIKCRRQIAA